jgi:biotin operon repressor
MSNHLIGATYKADLSTPMRKAVMVLLADKASDDGSGIWASKQTMADELCCSKQAVITTIKAFLAQGLLVEDGHRKAPTGYTNCYAINVEKLQSLALVKCWADKTKGSTSFTSQPRSPVNVTEVRGQPPLPKPSRTTLSNNKRTHVDKPDCVSGEVWGDWLGHRKAEFSATALKGFEREAATAGWSLESAITEAIERGWQGFKASWVKEKKNGTCSGTTHKSGKSQNGFATALQRIAADPVDEPSRAH